MPRRLVAPAAPFTGLTQHVFDVASDSYLAGLEKAKAAGIDIPASLLSVANDVIE